MCNRTGCKDGPIAHFEPSGTLIYSFGIALAYVVWDHWGMAGLAYFRRIGHHHYRLFFKKGNQTVFFVILGFL